MAKLLFSHCGEKLIIPERISLASTAPGFKFEAEMFAPVVRWMRRKRLAVKSEFPVPWGVCDLVGVSLNQERILKRLSFGQLESIGSLTRQQILAKIPDRHSGKPITLRSLEKCFSPFVSSEALRRDLEKLLKAKFVECVRRNSFQKINGWAPLHEDIVAVELKLARVAEAIAQASANTAFATQSYVALPGGLAHRILHGSRSEIFLARGVGLLAVTPNTCRELIKPGRGQYDTNVHVQAHVVERFWPLRGSCP